MKANSESAKVLVIDDERGPRESLRILLKEEFAVFCADSVDAGIGLLKDHAPDLVILDIRMPGKSGIEGLREVRQIDSHVAVVMLTGFGALETAQEALRLGATDYLNKPFDTREMRQMVRQYTKRTRLERKRVEMLAELQAMNERLVRDLADKEQLASMGQSSAEFAHDLRNPLMIVNGYVDLLTDQIEKSRTMMGGEFEEVSDYLDVIEQNVKRCCELVQMWQKLGRNGCSEVARVEMATLWADVVSGVAPLASAEGVGVEYDLGDLEEVAIHGSHAQLLRAIHNVVCNAIDAVSGAEGRVKVAGRRRGEQAEIGITDNGCGMTPDVLASLFVPYFTTKAKGRGTGLGMVITKKIVEEHEGSIRVDSRVGEGTTVLIALPIEPERAGETTHGKKAVPLVHAA